MECGKILGVDFGEKKIGLSLADTETKIAFAFGVLENDKSTWLKLREIISKEEICLVVVGLPTYVNRGEIEYPGEVFGQKLQKDFEMKVVYHNEMFTTKMAKANLMQKGMKDLDKHDDAEAARLILQSWLDEWQF